MKKGPFERGVRVEKNMESVTVWSGKKRVARGFGPARILKRGGIGGTNNIQAHTRLERGPEEWCRLLARKENWKKRAPAPNGGGENQKPSTAILKFWGHEKGVRKGR